MSVNFDHRDIACGICTNHFAFKLALIVKNDGDLRRVPDYVVVGEDITVGRNNRAGAKALLPLFTGLVWKHIAEELAEERIRKERRLLNLNHLSGCDCNNGWQNRLSNPLISRINLLKRLDIRTVQPISAGKNKNGGRAVKM